MFELEVYHPHVTEVTVINRQSYMAEISSLLSLITDDNTRVALIDQMERMFDAAPDEERLIQEIGNPTKVAVALIRYADSGKITPAAAPVVAPEQAQSPKKPQYIDETKYRPVEDVVFDAPEALEQPAEEPDGGYYSEEDEQYEDDGGYSEEEGQYEDDGYYAEEEGAYEDEENPFDEMFDELEVETITKTNPFLAVLYTIAAIIVGVPVFVVLLALNLCFFAIGVAVVAGGIALTGTAFIGLSVVADMLILLGSGASVLAIAMVLLWFAIWFFVQVTIGWIRVLIRLGKRWCCKEVEVA